MVAKDRQRVLLEQRNDADELVHLVQVVVEVVVAQHAAQVRRALADEPHLVFLHAGYLAAAIAVALHSTTDFGLHMPANGALFSVVLGIVVGLEGAERNRVQ